jgi:uncharacterized glyoxalase superfamily metalloenzyme YdcJ
MRWRVPLHRSVAVSGRFANPQRGCHCAPHNLRRVASNQRTVALQNAAINSYKTLISDNQWDLNYNLRMEDISMERISSAPLAITIKGQHINAIKYRLSKFEYDDRSIQSKEDQKQYLDIYLSKHLTIPYRIDDIKNEKILEIQYFNPLEKEVE